MYFRELIHFIVYSNIWIALGATASCFQFYLLTNEPPDYFLLVFIFFSTHLTYTYQRYAKIQSGSHNNSARMEWMKKRPRFVNWSMLISISVTLFIVASFPFEAFVFLSAMAAISFYYIQKLPGKNRRNLRDRPFIKIYLIAGVWALTSVVLPMLLLEEFVTEELWLVLINFLFILAITIPFDIRDLEFDEEDKKTIPQLIGVDMSKVLALICSLASSTLIVYFFPEHWPPILGSTLFSVALILGSKVGRKDQYYSFFVDGLLILQTALIFLFTVLSANESIAYP